MAASELEAGLAALAQTIQAVTGGLGTALQGIFGLGTAFQDQARQAETLQQSFQQAALQATNLSLAEAAASDPAAMRSLRDEADAAAQASAALTASLAANANATEADFQAQRLAAARADDLAEALTRAKEAAADPGKMVALKGERIDADRKAQDLGQKAQDAAPSKLGAVGGAVAEAASGAGAIEGVIGKIQEFVGALNPGLIDLFNMAVANLQATIGVALEPVFQALIPVVEQISGALLPIMQELNPVIASLMNVIKTSLNSTIGVLVTLFQALAPVLDVCVTIFGVFISLMEPIKMAIQLLAEVFVVVVKLLMVVLQPLLDTLKLFSAYVDGMSQAFQVLMVVVMTLADAFVAMFASGSSLQDDLARMRSAIQGMVNAFLTFTAQLLMLFGMRDVLDKLIKNLGPKTGAVAAGQISTQNLDSIIREMNESAAKAGGGEDKDSWKFDLTEARKAMQDIADGNNQMKGLLVDMAESLRLIAKLPKLYADTKSKVAGGFTPFGSGKILGVRY